MRVIEQTVVPRTRDAKSLDAVVVTERWAGVVDQSTPKNDNEPDLLDAFKSAVVELSTPDSSTSREVVDVINASVRAMTTSADGGPCLTFAIADVVQRRVIRVGDCHVLIGDREHRGRNPVDEVLGPMRSLVADLSTTTAESADPDDPGRSVILPWIKRAAAVLRNHPTSRFGFGAIDGSPVPDRYVEEFPVQPGDTIAALMTDGYPRPALHLEDAERALASALERDPTMAELDVTKGRRGGDNSFDDRAFVSLDLTERT